MCKIYKFVVAVMLLPINNLLAITPSPSVTTVSEKISIWQLFIPLAVVLIAIFAFAFLVKRFGKKIPMLNSEIKIRSMAGVSNNAKLALIEIEGNSLLIGVTNQKVNLIKDLTGKLDLPKDSANPNLKKQFSDYFKSGGDKNKKIKENTPST